MARCVQQKGQQILKPYWSNVRRPRHDASWEMRARLEAALRELDGGHHDRINARAEELLEGLRAAYMDG
jgi:hypothetical protein